MRYAPQNQRTVKIELNYFDGEFSIKNADFSKVQPFCHADVVVNCDHALSSTGGILERKVELFLSDTLSSMGVKAKWDKSLEWHQLRQREGHNLPNISKFGMGIDFYF